MPNQRRKLECPSAYRNNDILSAMAPAAGGIKIELALCIGWQYGQAATGIMSFIRRQERHMPPRKFQRTYHMLFVRLIAGFVLVGDRVHFKIGTQTIKTVYGPGVRRESVK